MAERQVGPESASCRVRQNLPEQIKIGGIYLASTFVVLGLTALIDGGILARTDAPANASSTTPPPNHC